MTDPLLAKIAKLARGLRVVRGSLVRPTLALDEPLDGPDAERATALGASILAWEGADGWSHWRACFAPVTARPLRGRPTFTKRWILVDEPDVELVPRQPSAETEWHVLVSAARAELPAHAVQWPRFAERIVAPLLGACTVAGRDGPLVYDAWRLGREVLAPDAGAIESWPRRRAPSRAALLARSIPPLLWQSPRYFEALERGSLTPRMNAEALREAREASLRSEKSLGGRVRRAWNGLLADPRGTAGEARLWVARTLFSSARRPVVRVRR